MSFNQILVCFMFILTPSVLCSESVVVNGEGKKEDSVPQGTLYIPSRPPVVVNGVTLMGRPNPYVANTTGTWFGWGIASYHALNVSLTKRASRGLSFKTNYSWGKVLDLNSAILAVPAKMSRRRRSVPFIAT